MPIPGELKIRHCKYSLKICQVVCYTFVEILFSWHYIRITQSILHFILVPTPRLSFNFLDSVCMRNFHTAKHHLKCSLELSLKYWNKNDIKTSLYCVRLFCRKRIETIVIIHYSTKLVFFPARQSLNGSINVLARGANYQSRTTGSILKLSWQYA